MAPSTEPERKAVLVNEVLLEDGWHAVQRGSDELPAIWAYGIDDRPVSPYSSLAVRHEFIESATDFIYYVPAARLYAIRGEIVETLK